jgi:hypothetical protein
MRDMATGARGDSRSSSGQPTTAQKAIISSGFAFDGRPLVVNEARPKPEGGGAYPRGGSRGQDMGGRREPRW